MSKRLLFVAADLPFFLSHRLCIARMARDQGFTVALACPAGDQLTALAEEGIQYLPFPVRRGSVNPFAELAVLIGLGRQIRDFQPDVMHLISSKAVIYGGLLARSMNIPAVSALTGMGYLFTSQTATARVLRLAAVGFYRLALNHSKSHVIFQNSHDHSEAERLGLLGRASWSFIGGSGADLSVIFPKPLPAGPPVVLMPSRMLVDKGVQEFVEAARLLRRDGSDAVFRLMGDPDPDNPSSINLDQLRFWNEEGVVQWFPHSGDINDALAQAHLVVLPSYREGFPKTLIDAAAAGRATVTTDVPGCRDAIVAGKTGVLVPARDARALALAITDILKDRDRLAEMGTLARRHAEDHFDDQQVSQRHIEIYDALLRRKGE